MYLKFHGLTWEGIHPRERLSIDSFQFPSSYCLEIKKFAISLYLCLQILSFSQVTNRACPSSFYLSVNYPQITVTLNFKGFFAMHIKAVKRRKSYKSSEGVDKLKTACHNNGHHVCISTLLIHLLFIILIGRNRGQAGIILRSLSHPQHSALA